MDLDALFRMPMTRRPGDGGVRSFACKPGAGPQPFDRPGGATRKVCLAIGLSTGR